MAGRMVLYKLVVLGDGGVGKTALTIQLCLQHFVETVSSHLSDLATHCLPPPSTLHHPLSPLLLPLMLRKARSHASKGENNI